MTKIWGPLGWATLHSIAALYPDEPSDLERTLLDRWIDSFRRCIVCEKCHQHFTKMLTEYKRMYPMWNTSRKELSLFVLRAHNTVNARTQKPVYSVSDALSLLRQNVSEDKAHLMRQSYIVFIQRDWSRHTSLQGITALRIVQDMITTETEYWGKRQLSWDEIAPLVEGESVGPIQSILSEGRSLSLVQPRAIPRLVSPQVTRIQAINTAPTAIPRAPSGPIRGFSFLSR